MLESLKSEPGGCLSRLTYLGARTSWSAFFHSIFAVQATTTLTASSTGLEAIAIEGNALALWARAPSGILLEWTKIQRRRAEEIKLVEFSG